ncbi:MAG TPA: DoxX family protein [Gaiellaceae bacterium]|jgi:putative oxidoreductase|nr:DoxX family protein [Gaiellaceae bacterium]
MAFWRLLARVTIGLLFVGHGTQKLFGWFGGEGPKATGKTMEKLGLRPGREHAIAAGLAEAGGGAMLAAGAATPFAAAGLTAAMLTATKRVHLRNGLWVTNRGYEYNLVLISALLALVESGPGNLSVDAARGRVRSGAGWAAFAFGAGSLGAYAVELLAERGTPAPIAWLEQHVHAAHKAAA